MEKDYNGDAEETLPGYLPECDDCPARLFFGDDGMVTYGCNEPACIYGDRDEDLEDEEDE